MKLSFGHSKRLHANLPDPFRRTAKPEEDQLRTVIFNKETIFHLRPGTVEGKLKLIPTPLPQRDRRTFLPGGRYQIGCDDIGESGPQFCRKLSHPFLHPKFCFPDLPRLLKSSVIVMSLRRFIASANHYAAMDPAGIFLQRPGKNGTSVMPAKAGPQGKTEDQRNLVLPCQTVQITKPHKDIIFLIADGIWPDGIELLQIILGFLQLYHPESTARRGP